MTPFLTLNGRFLQQHVTGVQRVAREVLQVLDELAASGQVPAARVLVPARGDLIAPPALSALSITRVGLLGGHAWEQLELPRHCGREPLLCLGNTAPVRRLLAGPDRPTVTMVHDLSYRYFPSAYSKRFRALYSALMPVVMRRSARVVTVSRAEACQIARHFPVAAEAHRLSFLQNGGLPDHAARRALESEPTPVEQRPYGIYVGSLTRRKNAEGLLQAAVAFLRAYPQMRFVVIGASSASFEHVSVDIPDDIASRLEFRGQINDADAVYDAYRHARFLLFPSFYEASPLPPVEAMTFGCPVIASRIPSLVERCGDSAVYCDPHDPESIMGAIHGVMGSADRWRSLSLAAARQAARYSWKEQTLGLLSLCEEAR